MRPDNETPPSKRRRTSAISARSTSPPPPEIPRPPLTKLLTPEEVADELGLARETIYRLLREEKLPGVKLGGRWVVSQSILSDWLKGEGLL